jgi:lon-related putative ATP-dependent protease
LEELDPLDTLIGQERAVEAMSFAVAMDRKGYNLFVLGPSGTGKHTFVADFLAREAKRQPPPLDWFYVNNFADSRKPHRLSLPAGRAVPFRDAMDRLITELRAALPAAFERDDYRARREVIDQQLKQRHEQTFGELQNRAESQQVSLVRTPMGLTLLPTQNGETISPDAFNRLPESERAQIRERIEALQTELEALMRKVPEWEREHRDAVRQLNRDTAARAIDHLIAELRAGYQDQPAVLAYLDAVERDIQDHADDFLGASQSSASDTAPSAEEDGAAERARFRRYRVNVMADNRDSNAAPVVYEDHPTHQTLVGRIEHMARFGTLMTDFNLIVPGALHRANGGYLILDAHRLLTGSFGWESLKRALGSGEIRIESLEQLLSVASTASLEPEAIPLDIKIVLVGPPLLYYLLSTLDPEFKELFKVAADFEDSVTRDAPTAQLYARLIAGIVRREKLRPFDPTAVARVIEQAARLSGDAEKLSTETRSIVELLQEADYHAGAERKDIVGADDVQAAIDAQVRRSDRIYRRVQEEIGRHTLRIETEGEQIGQVNGLAVMQLGGCTFGHPNRITAQVRLGRGEVIDIEREVQLGGPLHSKGVLILSGFLGGRFGKDRPLSLTASLVFEQSYGGIDGDSASAAELFALLSALAAVPIRQSLAVTGSVDQRGQIQAIGGVNEKIEGFFDACRARGLTGTQGVVIPAANVKHLMLRRAVVEAAAAGQFAVYAIETVDQGIELLTGMTAGVPDAQGRYPQDTFNHRVATRLDGFARRLGPDTSVKERPQRRRPRAQTQ